MTYLVKISVALKPFLKLTYVIATMLIAGIIYQLVFSPATSHAESNFIIVNLLALAWVALVNLMIQLYSQVPNISQNKPSLLTRIKTAFHRCLYYVLSLLFFVISMAVIILTFKILSL